MADAALAVNNAIMAAIPSVVQFLATMPAGRSLTGNLLGTKANLKAAGFAGLDGTFGASDGTITFATGFAFDFDNSGGVTSGITDFQTVAAREIGHVLGFFSTDDDLNCGATSVSPNTLDLSRFANNIAG